MPYKKINKNFVALNFVFCCQCVETINNRCIRHNATVLYVSRLPAYWETNTADVSEQMMQHFFM